jgi:Tfp pilus assembly protein PilO
VSRLNDKQVLIATIATPVVVAAAFAFLAFRDWQAVYAAELSDENPSAAEVTDPAEWGERRKCQEMQKEIDTLRGEADVILKREQDVIVYREIVQRDAQLLPDRDLVNKLAVTIDEFATQAGVALTRTTGLNPGAGDGAIKRIPITLAVTGSYDQFLKFLNLFETMDRIVNVRGFQVTAGNSPGDGAPAQHTITLELETYMYSVAAGLAKPVEIPNYDRRKEEPSIQKLIKQQRAARIEKYQLKPRINRRDPLVDPRRAQSDDDREVDPKEEAEQKALLDKLKIDTELLNEDVRQLNQYLTEKKYVQVVQLRAIIEDRLASLDLAIADASKKITISSLGESFQDEVVAVYTRIKELAPQKVGPLVFDRRTAVQLYEAMRVADEAKNYEGVVEQMRRVEDFTKDRTIADDATDVVANMHDLARQAAVLLEFEKIPIRFSGRIRRPEGSIVLLNDKSMKIGDFLDEKRRCKLVEIDDETLVFDFDGLEIRRQISKQK